MAESRKGRDNMKGCTSCRRRYEKKSIWVLPEELLLLLLKGLHIKDLLNVRTVHPAFRDLIDERSIVWTQACFKDVWPSLSNMRHITRAADHGNVEALVKLGIAYLYNEGLPVDVDDQNATINGEIAAEMFCKVEELLPNVTPFTWLFIRPPWATLGPCCKKCVFNNMKKYTEKHNAPNVTVCIAKTLQLLAVDDHSEQEIVRYLQQATTARSPNGSFLLWQHRYTNQKEDAALELEAIRELRNIVSLSDPDAILQLCRFYVQRKYGGIKEIQAASFVRNFIKISKPNHIEGIYRQTELTHSMRYILVDWLVEVATIKNFGSPTLHTAISVVDRFLYIHRTSRAQFQLLGVAAMVLCSRFLGKDIITIREAAWLTDNTYKYEDVVRMMGEIVATLRGNIRVWCILDYAQLIGLLASNEEPTQCLAEYVCELALLQSDLGQYPQAEIAASAVLLARLAHQEQNPWAQQMVQFTGYSISHLAACTLNILEKCFMEEAVLDHREVVLQAIKQRYADERFHKASSMKIPTTSELQEMLGMQKPVSAPLDVEREIEALPHLIMSPSRNRNGQSMRWCKLSDEREKAATPSVADLNKSMEAMFSDSARSDSDLGLEELEDTSFAETICDSGSGSISYEFDESLVLPVSPKIVNHMPVLASTPSVRINLPSFSFVTSSPIAKTSGGVGDHHMAHSSSLAESSHPSSLSSSAMNLSMLNASDLQQPPFASGFHQGLSSSSNKKKSSAQTPLSFTLYGSSDQSVVDITSADSGIDTITVDPEESNNIVNNASTSADSNLPSVAPQHHNYVNCVKNQVTANKEVRHRKRRNSSNLSNEQKTYVIAP